MKITDLLSRQWGPPYDTGERRNLTVTAQKIFDALLDLKNGRKKPFDTLEEIHNTLQHSLKSAGRRDPELNRQYEELLNIIDETYQSLKSSR